MKSQKNLKRLKVIKEIISKGKKLRILELGVFFGTSTTMFLKSPNVKNLISVDINDCSKVSKSKKWKFLKTRDDNFKYINKFLKKKIDIVFIDSLHEPEHIEKLIYFYYRKIKVGGKILIDDVSWLQHVKNARFDNDFTEIINRLIFKKIIEIYFTNQDKFNLKIDFSDSGLAIITKIRDKLNVSKKIKDRSFSFKNILKQLYRPKPIPNSFKRYQKIKNKKN
tara:strand:- start:12 stop:680 length:669 start_codon:yes stop_codon:yes gene_type:complete